MRTVLSLFSCDPKAWELKNNSIVKKASSAFLRRGINVNELVRSLYIKVTGR
jgi:hypothetical protein